MARRASATTNLYGGIGRGGAGLERAVDLLLSKQDEQGQWKMAYSYNGKVLKRAAGATE